MFSSSVGTAEVILSVLKGAAGELWSRTTALVESMSLQRALRSSCSEEFGGEPEPPGFGFGCTGVARTLDSLPAPFRAVNGDLYE
jgi:hypothetical protein